MTASQEQAGEANPGRADARGRMHKKSPRTRAASAGACTRHRCLQRTPQAATKTAWWICSNRSIHPSKHPDRLPQKHPDRKRHNTPAPPHRQVFAASRHQGAISSPVTRCSQVFGALSVMLGRRSSTHVHAETKLISLTSYGPTQGETPVQQAWIQRDGRCSKQRP